MTNWIRANVDLTDRINRHQAEAKKLLNLQIQAETGKALPPSVLDEAFYRMQVAYARHLEISDNLGYTYTLNQCIYNIIHIMFIVIL